MTRRIRINKNSSLSRRIPQGMGHRDQCRRRRRCRKTRWRMHVCLLGEPQFISQHHDNRIWTKTGSAQRPTQSFNATMPATRSSTSPSQFTKTSPAGSCLSSPPSGSCESPAWTFCDSLRVQVSYPCTSVQKSIDTIPSPQCPILTNLHSEDEWRFRPSLVRIIRRSC